MLYRMNFLFTLEPFNNGLYFFFCPEVKESSLRIKYSEPAEGFTQAFRL